MTEEKSWPCRHIIKHENGEWCILIQQPNGTTFQSDVPYWDICPVKGCGAKRPEKKADPLDSFKNLFATASDSVKDGKGYIRLDCGYVETALSSTMNVIERYRFALDEIHKIARGNSTEPDRNEWRRALFKISDYINLVKGKTGG